MALLRSVVTTNWLSARPRSGRRHVLLDTFVFMATLGACSSTEPAKTGPDAAIVATVDGGEVDAQTSVEDSGSETDASTDGATGAAFTQGTRSAETCPLGPAACATWPTAVDGSVYRYTSTERFQGKTVERSYHVFVPAAATSAAPLVVVLHGGNGSGSRLLASLQWTELATAKSRGLDWQPNTATCKALPTSEANGLAYRAEDAAPCVPPVATAVNTKPFIIVYPDGIPDPGTQDRRHWEDGRTPSPGFDTPTANRDDVGFVDHVVDVLLRDGRLPIDPSSIYLAGVSNGGMMTQRIASRASDPAYPRLARIAAYAAFVSNLPEPITLAPATVKFGLALYHGTGIVMPDCGTPGCTTPTVLGDDRMPFGTAGGVHFVNSPDRGKVRSGPDTIAAWRASLGGGQGVPQSIGYFTTRTVYAALPATFQSWVTEGGGHSFSSGRMDFHPVVSAWSFLSSFKRDVTTGALLREQPVWVTGTF